MRADGSVVDATFEVAQVPVYEIVFHHKAGGRENPRSVNADYHEGLELLLTRLASCRAKIIGISVHSGVARELDPEARELALPFPIALDPSIDCRALRLEITRAQKSVARRVGAKPGGGNDQKQILITITVYDGTVDFEALRDLLVGGGPEGRTDVDVDADASTGPVRRRRNLPKVRDLVAAGMLPVGTRLVADVGGQIK